MHATTPRSLTAAQITQRVRPIVVCCALAMAGSAGAQATQPSGTRGIFMATIAALIAQGVGTGLGTAASDGIVGSIKGWFNREPKPVDASAADVPPDEPKAGLHAGIAYEVHLIGQDRTTQAVDPAHHVFRTGDRFQVFYRPTLPGRVRVSNVDPRGAESPIDALEVAAGQLAALGPYQFVGAKGEETLRLVLEPCSSPVLTAATRSIVKVGAASTVVDPAVRLGDCSDPGTRSLRAKTRSVGKPRVEGTTVFALDPLSGEETRSGQVGAREVRISLKHQ